MRLTTNEHELLVIRELLPQQLLQAPIEWSNLDALGFAMRSDLFYFDVVESRMLALMPQFLKEVDEDACYLFDLTYTPSRNGLTISYAIEIATNTLADEIELKLRPTTSETPAQYSAHYLNGAFGIAARSRAWLILAEIDDKAAFLSQSEIAYLRFQKLWWSNVFESTTTPTFE